MEADKNDTWYYSSPDKRQLGPFPLEKLRALARAGELVAETSVWCPEFPDWIPANKVPGLIGGEAPFPTQEISAASPYEPKTLKPNKGSFLFPRIMVLIVVSGLICGIAGGLLAVMEGPFLYAVAGFVLFVGLGLSAGLVAYRKERYVLEGSRLVCHRGELFSDQTSEFEIRNITHVKTVLPWLRFRFFKVGNVIVETAGTSKPMVMYAIHDPESTFAELRSLMRRNGYDLTQGQLLHQEKPALIGILGEILGAIAGILMLCLFSLGGMIELLQSADAGLLHVLVPASAALIALSLIGFTILRILDYRRRTYSVFNDVVVYEEGFLTRHNAFIPYENIADSNTKCSLLDRILGLFDVQVSCQGSSSEIRFRRLRNGIALSQSIDELVVSASRKPKPARIRPENASSPAKRTTREEPLIVGEGNPLVADFRIHPGRIMVPQLFLLPLFPLWIIVMVKTLILVTSTRYFVRSGSLRHSFRFLTVHDREFSNDKITGLVIKTNLWDKMFGTFTLRFWSIGSAKVLEFAHVHRSQVDLPALMRQIGIPEPSPAPYSAQAQFGFLTWLRRGVIPICLLLLLAAGFVAAGIRIDQGFHFLTALPLALLTGSLIHGWLYFPRQRLLFHGHHVEAVQGIIAKRSYFVRYRNVKRTLTKKYPWGDDGDLRIFVAGEEEAYPQSREMKGRQPMLRQCSFNSGMLPGIRQKGLLLDDILSGRVEPSPTAEPEEPSPTVIETPRSAATAVTSLLLLSILLFPLIALLPITIPVTILRVKRWRYRVDEARISRSWGVLFKKEESVIHDRVDSLQQSQGPLNKVFRNGKVSIMTAGSSKPDLVIIDAPAYLGIYEAIRERSN